MGKQDLLAKEYMSDNAKFADVFNYYLYNGRQIIKSENLREENISEMAIPFGTGKAHSSFEKYRDIIKKCVVKRDSNYTYFLLGIENQSEVHYAMPVITLVIYWGNEIWDAPKSLYEMFSDTNLDTLKFINDYRINLISPKEIKDFTIFKTELGKVLEFINASDNLMEMKKILENNREYYLHMGIESARMIETFGKTKIDMDMYEKEEEINMCKAIDDMILEGKQEGLQEGLKQGEQKGLKQGLQEGLRASIEMAKEFGITRELITKQIEKRFQLSQDEAMDAMNKYYS